MNIHEPKPEHFFFVSGLLLIFAILVAIPIGIGLLLGAGAGWLAFAIACIGVAILLKRIGAGMKKTESEEYSEWQL